MTGVGTARNLPASCVLRSGSIQMARIKAVAAMERIGGAHSSGPRRMNRRSVATPEKPAR
jgi:hypothetical protein